MRTRVQLARFPSVSAAGHNGTRCAAIPGMTTNRRAPKYGIRYSSIRYFQQEAAQHVRYNGKPAVFAAALSRELRTGASAQRIARAAIGAAAVLSPEQLKAAIQQPDTFGTWPELLDSIAAGHKILYKAPLDYAAVLVSCTIRRDGRVRCAAVYSDVTFTADSGHLSRFRRF